MNYKINKFLTNLKQMNNKRTSVNLYKDIVLVYAFSLRHCLPTTT